MATRLAERFGSATADFPPVKTTWSTVEKTSIYGPYFEHLNFVLLLRLWSDDALRAEFKRDPKDKLRREAKLELPAAMSVTVVEDTPDLFHFVLPRIPPADEFNTRFQQIADWWMLAHYLATRQMRDGKSLAQADAFRQSVEVFIIGRSWIDPAFRQAMIDDAKGALERETGATFRPSLKILAPVDTDANITIPIPKRPTEEDLLEEDEHLASWFLAGHGTWYFLVNARLLRPLPTNSDDLWLS